MYCITLRSRVDARITGWFDGSDSRWSTDYKRQKLFDEKRDARSVCQELRELCPRNAKFINVEAVYDIALDGRRSDPRDLGELSYERLCTPQVVAAGSSSSPRAGDPLDGAWDLRECRRLGSGVGQAELSPTFHPAPQHGDVRHAGLPQLICRDR